MTTYNDTKYLITATKKLDYSLTNKKLIDQTTRLLYDYEYIFVFLGVGGVNGRELHFGLLNSSNN